MAAAQFSTPRTWSTGEVVQADGSSGLNAQIRDNMLCVAEHILAQHTATAAAAAIDLVQIPQGYESLRLTAAIRVTAASDRQLLALQFSSSTSATPTFDTATNYATKTISSTGSAVVGSAAAGTTAASFGAAVGANATAGGFGGSEARIYGYARATHKVLIGQSALRAGATAGDIRHDLTGSFWVTTAPIQAIRVFEPAGSNISSGSVLTLYGSRTTATSS